MIQLSILICSLVSRKQQLKLLLNELDNQVTELNAGNIIEVLTNTDNKEKTTGAKRQELLEQAKGEYIIFIDDDDWPEPCYIAELMAACKSGKDCFAMNGYMTTNGKNKIEWKLSKDYENKTKYTTFGGYYYLRKTNHITGVRRAIALRAGFPDKSNAEDKWYSDRVAPLCKSEHQIIPLLYHYRFLDYDKEYR